MPLTRVGSAVEISRGALPGWPLAVAIRSTEPEPGAGATEARIRSAELRPVPPAIGWIKFTPPASVTAPSVSVETVLERPWNSRYPPRIAIGAESGTRSATANCQLSRR